MITFRTLIRIHGPIEPLFVDSRIFHDVCDRGSKDQISVNLSTKEDLFLANIIEEGFLIIDYGYPCPSFIE